MICAFGETTGLYALQSVLSKMKQDPEGQLILK